MNQPYTLTNELVGGLLVRGIQPDVQAAEVVGDQDVVSIPSTDLHFNVYPDAISLDERMEFGGNVTIENWSLDDGEALPRFVASVIHETWPTVIAALPKKRK